MNIYASCRLATVAAVGVGLGLGAVAARAEPVTLKIADWLPSGHLVNETILNVMIPALEKDGLFKVEYFPAEQLGSAGENLDFARSGVIDIGYFAPGYGSMAGRVPATNALTLPGLFDSATQATNVYMDLAQGSLKQEYDALNIRMLIGVGTSIYEVFSKKEVRLPGDIVGLKMRAAGGDADDFLREMGVPIVNMPSPQMYEALERGVLDATLYPPSAAPSRHLEEVTTHFTANAPLSTPLVTYFIDLGRYNGFTPEQQAAIDTASREAALAMAAEYDRRNEEYKTVLVDAGMTMTTLTDEERQAWREAYSGAADAFIQKISGRGFDYVDEVYDEILSLAEKHAH